MTIKKPSQQERILTILERDGCISNLDAIQNKISYRLGARIYDLRQQGYVIYTQEDETGNAVYHLISEPEPKQMSLV